MAVQLYHPPMTTSHLGHYKIGPSCTNNDNHNTNLAGWDLCFEFHQEAELFWRQNQTGSFNNMNCEKNNKLRKRKNIEPPFGNGDNNSSNYNYLNCDVSNDQERKDSNNHACNTHNTNTNKNIAKVCMEEQHLFNAAKVGQYRIYYMLDTWACSPLNPSSLDSNNIGYLLFTNEGQREHSILTVSAYHALSVSSFSLGDYNLALEFHERAREALGDVFDETNYDLALVLISMAFWSRFYAKTETDATCQMVYYLNQCVQICERLGDTHSDVYQSAVRELIFFNAKPYSDEYFRVLELPEVPEYAKNWNVEKQMVQALVLQKSEFNKVIGLIGLGMFALERYKMTKGAYDGVEQRQKENDCLRSNNSQLSKRQLTEEYNACEIELAGCRAWLDKARIALLASETVLPSLPWGARFIIQYILLVFNVEYFSLVQLPDHSKWAALTFAKHLTEMPYSYQVLCLSHLAPQVCQVIIPVLAKEHEWDVLKKLVSLVEPFSEYHLMKTVYTTGCAKLDEEFHQRQQRQLPQGQHQQQEENDRAAPVFLISTQVPSQLSSVGLNDDNDLQQRLPSDDLPHPGESGDEVDSFWAITPPIPSSASCSPYETDSSVPLGPLFDSSNFDFLDVSSELT